jgi:tetratricopeptide (TPR) repeat protein
MKKLLLFSALLIFFSSFGQDKSDDEVLFDEIQADPTSRSYFSAGLQKAKENNHIAAIELYTKSIKNDRYFALAYNARGASKFHLKDYRGSLIDLNKAIILQPEYGEAYFNRGLSKAYLSDNEGACTDAKQAEELGYDSKKLISAVCPETTQVEESLAMSDERLEVPIYPGCEQGSNADKRKCMSAKISKFVQRNFDTNISRNLGLFGGQLIRVIFKIDTNGNVIGVRSRAAHSALEIEAIRVINLLPKMKPGLKNGKAVIVPYSLPITFQVQ